MMSQIINFVGTYLVYVNLEDGGIAIHLSVVSVLLGILVVVFLTRHIWQRFTLLRHLEWMAKHGGQIKL